MRTASRQLAAGLSDESAAYAYATGQLLAAAFRGFGYDAEMMAENRETLAIGLKHTLGGECVPCPSTAGSLISSASGVWDVPPPCGG